MNHHKNFRDQLPGGFLRLKYLKDIEEKLTVMSNDHGIDAQVEVQLTDTWEVLTSCVYGYSSVGHAEQTDLEKVTHVDAEVLAKFVAGDKELKWPWPVRIKYSLDKGYQGLVEAFNAAVRSLDNGPMAWSKRFVETEDKKAAREQAYAQEVGERIQRIVDVLLTMGFSRKKASDLVVDAVYEDAAATDDEILNKIMNMEFDQ